jgi:3-hydroxymyristoyl/3-hydroxydecanoyl-(acyl carrier protein) dehydratase
MGSETIFPSDVLLRLARESALRSSSLHGQFLAQRKVALNGVQALIELQIRAAGGSPAAAAAPVQPALFTSEQLDAFGTGKISDCLGPNFARYDGYRMARIPNGDLKMMSRVISISGKPGDFSQPADVQVVYDVPPDTWYLRDHAGVDLPFSLVMETALQPCGFLMAYLDTYSALPMGEYYFRNLDGWIRMLGRQPIAGKQIVTHARMISSVISAGTLIQKFSFELGCNGEPFCEGETVFGYFPAEAMASQVGLDGGKTTQAWLQHNPGGPVTQVNMPQRMQPQSGSPRFRLSGGRMNFLGSIQVQKDGGKYGKGYVYAARTLDPKDWFYPFHFHQDPVMPGSLGVEAILQAMQAYALESGLGEGLRTPFFGLAQGQVIQWRYRGQIVQANRKMELEVHMKDIQPSPGGRVLLGDASLWVDGLRIYEVKNAAIGILEG